MLIRCVGVGVCVCGVGGREGLDVESFSEYEPPISFTVWSLVKVYSVP